jgi:adenosylcobinamide-phosphate synthase
VYLPSRTTACCWRWPSTWALLYLTLGFRQFSHYFTDIRDALDRGDENLARQPAGRMAPPRRQRTAAHRGAAPRDRARAAGRAPACVRRVLLVRRAVGLGLGPMGAVLYRMAEFASRYWGYRHRALDVPPTTGCWRLSRAPVRWIDHVPARLTAFGFAVVGNFEEAIGQLAA